MNLLHPNKPQEFFKNQGLSDLVKAFLDHYVETLEGENPPFGLYDIIISEVEKPLFLKILELCKGNQKQAAAILGIHRNTLRRKMVDYGMTA